MEMATLVIPETKVYDRIGDNCDVGGSTWCNILSMSIGAWATPSKGIGDSLGEESSSFTEGSTPAINHLRCIHIYVCCQVLQLKRQLFGTTLSSLHLSVELDAGEKHYMTPGWSRSAPPLRWPNTPPGSNNNCFSSGKFSSQVHCCFLSSSLLLLSKLILCKN